MQSTQFPFGVSVVICCHNSAARLPATLAHLVAQKVSKNIPWEVLIIDNASTDGTATVARECWGECHFAPLRIVREQRPGTAFARQRGIAEARYELVSFVDDDNWVTDQWVELTASFLRSHADVGALGGLSTPVFEVSPPSWFPACKAQYAISPETWLGGECTETRSLWTAGMTLRKSAWQQLEFKNIPILVPGRSGGSLTAGEDTELCYRLRLAGWKLWYEPRLQFQHYMPKDRLNWAYARRLYRGAGKESAALLPYETVLHTEKSEAYSIIKQSWEWKLLATAKGLLLRPRVLMRVATGNCEGDLEMLYLEVDIGRFTALARGRSSFYASINQVKKLAERLHSRGGERAIVNEASRS